VSEQDRERQHDEQVDSNEQPFLAHLLELRQRLLRSLLFLAVVFVPVFYFNNEIFDFVSGPLRAYIPGDMIAIQVATPFLTPFRLAIYTTIFATIPLLLHQAWGFVSPGLYLREKRFAIPLLVSSTALFYLGMAFAYYVVFPLAFRFFASVTPTGVAMMTDINQYVDFVLKMFFAFGVAFEIPVATVLLAKTGLVSPASMARKRPYVIVGCFVVGMVLTPPDVISQILLALPAWLLFEVGIILSRMVAPEDDADEAE
jgi:sec-independent protein translocase protein TatC